MPTQLRERNTMTGSIIFYPKGSVLEAKLALDATLGQKGIIRADGAECGLYYKMTPDCIVTAWHRTPGVTLVRQTSFPGGDDIGANK